MGRIARIAVRAASRFIPGLQKPLRCGGCGRVRSAGMQLVSGLGGYFCNECFALAAQQVTPRRSPPDAVRCRFCRLGRSPALVARVGSVAICADCLGQMEAVFAEADESQS
jgi:hypothetical protein